MLDTRTSHGAHIDRRLRTEPIIWLTTSSPAGLPHMVPMWFLWDGVRILLFSLPSTRKLRHIGANPAVVLALEAADQGYDIVIVDGKAVLLEDPSISGLMPAFVEKYRSVPRRWRAEEWARKFTQVVQVIPTKIRAWKTRPDVKPEYTTVRF